MNHTGFPLKRSFASEARVPRDTDDFIDLERLLAVVLRQARVLILCVLIGLGLGILYLTTTPPIYMAASHVLIDERLRKIVDDTSAVANDLQTDSSMLSQIEIVRSARLAEAVVDALALDRNESFMQPPTSLLAQAVGSARWAFRSVLSLFGQQPEQAVLHSGEGYEEMLGRARGRLSMGPSMDLEIFWDLFTNVLAAAAELKVNDDFTRRVRAARALRPRRPADPDRAAETRRVWRSLPGDSCPHRARVPRAGRRGRRSAVR
jgi:hypothetical protein